MIRGNFTEAVTIVIEFFNHRCQLLFFQCFSQLLCYSFQIGKRDFSLSFSVEQAEGFQSFLDWVTLSVFSLHNLDVVLIVDLSAFLNIELFGQLHDL